MRFVFVVLFLSACAAVPPDEQKLSTQVESTPFFEYSTIARVKNCGIAQSALSDGCGSVAGVIAGAVFLKTRVESDILSDQCEIEYVPSFFDGDAAAKCTRTKVELLQIRFFTVFANRIAARLVVSGGVPKREIRLAYSERFQGEVLGRNKDIFAYNLTLPSEYVREFGYWDTFNLQFFINDKNSVGVLIEHHKFSRRGLFERRVPERNHGDWKTHDSPERIESNLLYLMRSNF
jgi:hypothetical protein